MVSLLLVFIKKNSWTMYDLVEYFLLSSIVTLSGKRSLTTYLLLIIHDDNMNLEDPND